MEGATAGTAEKPAHHDIGVFAGMVGLRGGRDLKAQKIQPSSITCAEIHLQGRKKPQKNQLTQLCKHAHA